MNTSTIQPGLNLVFGFDYVIKNRISIGAELLPSVVYEMSNTKKKVNGFESNTTKTRSLRYGFTNDYVLITLSCRI